MKELLNVVRRNTKLFFKDKGMFFLQWLCLLY